MTHDSTYMIVGYVSSFLFLLTIYGIWDQIKKIQTNTSTHTAPGQATKDLSINQFLCHFLGVYAFFIYGFMIEEFNPYLVWPRMIAAFAVLVILFLIARDRREMLSSIIFLTCSLLLTFGIMALILSDHPSPTGALAAKLIILAVTLINAQGYIHQITKVMRNKSTTSMSFKMNSLIFAKDISSMLLGIMMGLSTGWPVIIQSSSNAFFRAILSGQIYYFTHTKRDEIKT